MQKRTSILKMISLATVAASLFACGKANSDAPMVDSAGKHPSDWIARHGAVALVSTTSCTECHAGDLSGGIAKVSCMSASPISGFSCHATSPAVNPGCASCHGGPPNGPDGTTAPNRQFAHDTHLVEVATIANSSNDVKCSFCHNGAGFGTANHAKATATGGIASATLSVPDTLRAKTITTTFGYDSASGICSGIICHGGKPTPSFRTGSITVETDCLTCHEQGTAPQTPQYNSFYSGQAAILGTNVNLHQLHLALNDPTATPSTTSISCTGCHNLTALATNHFSGLTTSAFEGSPASTIGGGTTKISAYTPYTSTVPSGNCTTACHAVKYWKN